MNKICFSCNIEKDSELFSKDKSKYDGLAGRCKECRKIFNSNNKEKDQLYRNNNKETILEYGKQHYKLNKVKIRKTHQLYEKKNKLKILDYHKKYWKHKYYSDINFKILVTLRARVCTLLKNKKQHKSITYLGCTIEQFKQHLESQFKPEMNWSNHGTVWEIDHIKACENFDLTILEEQNKCFHYSNTQPLFKTTEIAEQHGYLDEIGNRNKGTNEFKK